MRPSIARATVRAWNERYPIGQMVKVRLEGKDYITRTRSPASIYSGVPMLFVEGYPVSIELEKITPLVEEKGS